MSRKRLLLCTDMDRTVIPNGSQPEHPEASRLFREFCRLPEVSLVYVTGRHRALIREAIQGYHLPEPDFAVADVGTKIYRVEAGNWSEMPDWEEKIAVAWRGKSRQQIQQSLKFVSELRLQEEAQQNTYKLSYFLSLDSNIDAVVARVEDCLRQQGVEASLIYSVDETENIGLLDVLPREATKLHGIEFLYQHLGYRPDEVIFAGDSGNDLPVLGSSLRSVLVANASAEVKRQARELSARNGHTDSLYLAEDENLPIGGNYAAGVLQGVWHFAPHFHPQLKAITLSL